MATRTIARLFDSYEDASRAARDLEMAGFTSDQVSLIASGQSRGETTTARPDDSTSGTGIGASIGTLLGGGAGLAAGLGSLAIPGFGPVVAAGWLVAMLAGAGAGAVAGGLIGALAGAGISEEDARVYEEGVRRGGSLVTVRADESRLPEAEMILARHNPVDTQSRAAEWRGAGPTGDHTGTDTGMAPDADIGPDRTMPRR